MRMSHWTAGVLFALFGWYLVNFIGAPGVVTAEPLISLAGLMLVLLPILILMGLGESPYGLLALILVLLIWVALQLQTHWLGYFWGADVGTVLWHRKAWGSNWQLLPMAPGRTVPDGYHTVLGVLLMTALLSAFRDLFRRS